MRTTINNTTMSKKRNHKQVSLAYIRDELQRRKGYDDPDLAMDWLLAGFAAYLKRHDLGTPMTVSIARKTGYLSAYYANLFADYCDEGWRVV